MKQPIFVITKSSFDYILKSALNHKDQLIRFCSLSQADSQKIDLILEQLKALKADENGEILVSKMMEVFNGALSNKLIPHANGIVDFYKKVTTKKRSIKTISKNPQ